MADSDTRLRTFPNRVRELRVARGRGWTQERLAREARVSVGTISRLETGSRNPSPLVAYRIARALDVDVDELFPEPEKVA